MKINYGGGTGDGSGYDDGLGIGDQGGSYGDDE